MAPSTASSRNGSALPLALPLGLFFVAFVLAPMLLLAWVSLHDDAGMTQAGVGQYAKFLTDGFNLAVLGNTLWLGLKVTVLTILIGFPLAYLYTQAPGRWQGPLMLLIILPLLTSSVVRTFAWVVILGRQGIINTALLDLGLIAEPIKLLYTPGAVAIALAQIELPLMVLPLITALMNLDPNLRQASLALGAGHWRTFWQVTLPLSMPGLLAGSLLVFASSVSAFVTQTLVGGGQQMFMPFYMYQQAIQANNYPFAAAIAMLLLVCVLAVVVAINALGRRSKGFVHA
ncbi:ABC transporter permease [Variovorax ginsengisoli]|uniref:Spermidine/putrescine transport system permease protein n=1 Tax=Variovorax ginsengisoli TaxID=363844 RepID=A0ABT9SAJ1_9BURK|nr:ABC transporter permease [Variovorax ginsengisoli]MDP9900766.1 putative spermidine/putrescine transport system permease protein [Variovorax ginsengisoli]